jgi:hypothetical protein
LGWNIWTDLTVLVQGLSPSALQNDAALAMVASDGEAVEPPVRRWPAQVTAQRGVDFNAQRQGVATLPSGLSRSELGVCRLSTSLVLQGMPQAFGRLLGLTPGASRHCADHGQAHECDGQYPAAFV